MYGEPADGIEHSGLVRNAEVLNDRLPEDCLAIADCNSQDHVVLKFSDNGKDFVGVWYWDSNAFWDGEETLNWLSDTFSGFLSMLEYDVTAYEGEPEELPLFQAVQNGSFRAIEQYLGGRGEVEARNAQRHTLLMAAIIYTWPRIAALLNRGADPNARDSNGQTPLHHAASHSVDCVKLLLASGADAKARDNQGTRVRPDHLQHSQSIHRDTRADVAGVECWTINARAQPAASPVIRPGSP